MLGSSRKGALAMHKVITSCELKHWVWSIITPFGVWCGYHPPLRLRQMNVLEVESLASDHTMDLSKAGILV